MQSSLLRFVGILRSHSLPVSPSETLDAAAAMALIGYDDREILRDALAATLAKSRREEETFRYCFDRFFDQRAADFRVDSQATGKDRPAEPGPESGAGGDAAASSPAGGNGDGERLTEAAAESPALQTLLRGELLPALLENQRGTLSAALRRAAAGEQLEQIRLFTQKGQYTRRILDALGEQGLRDAVVELEQAQSPALDILRRYRDILRSAVRDHVEQQYLLHAEGRNDSFMNQLLSETRLSNIDRRHVDRVRAQVRRMARKLAARHSSLDAPGFAGVSCI
jgi:uncharacterized protein with von Willebrand factor type A (vWA) domain